MEFDYIKVCSNFNIVGEPKSCVRFGEGHINYTFLLTTLEGEKERKYVLQRINNRIFPRVDKLMRNIELVTEFTRSKIRECGGDADRESLTLVYTKDGKSYMYDEQSKEYFRVYKFIDDAISYQLAKSPELFYYSAVAFGNFANRLADFNASELFEVIPDFHNTVKRFNDFLSSIKENKSNKASSVKKEIDFVLARENYCSRIVELLKSGAMPMRVTHNDTKLNNVMLDSITGKPVAVVDLDTVMPGSICYDFGDSIRFGCNTALEDEKDLNMVNFDLELFESYVKGYLGAVGQNITDIEKENLAFGAILMTYECGMRFLSDHLDGDVYFNVKRENHNLDRARTQFKLVEEMEKVYDKMQEIVEKYS